MAYVEQLLLKLLSYWIIGIFWGSLEVKSALFMIDIAFVPNTREKRSLVNNASLRSVI